MDNGYLVRKILGTTRRFVLLIVLIGLFAVVGVVVVYFGFGRSQDQGLLPSNVQLPVTGDSPAIGDDLAQKLTVNAQLQVNGQFYLAPSELPSTAQAGQLVFDKTTNMLNYFNGTEFIPLSAVRDDAGPVGGVTSLQGQTGAINLVPGAGIAINGTVISSNGILGINGVSGDINVTTANGIATVSLPQSIAPTSHPVFDGLSLANALEVGSGGTGAVSFTPHAILIGNGTGSFGTVSTAIPGQCLISTAGAPTFGACAGGGAGVSSLNGIMGNITIANAAGVGSTVTIDDASTSQKGIAQFNATNFTVVGGAVNTAQNIHSGATPTFAGLTLSSALSVASGGTGATSHTAGAILFGNGTGALGNSGVLGNGQLLIGDGSGAPTVATLTQGSGIIVTNGAGSITLAVDTTVCRTSGNCAGVGGIGDILQGGNSFGSSMTIGTNDAQSLILKTNNVTRLTIQDDGDAVFSGNTQILGLALFNGGITLEAGDTLTVNNDAVTDLTGDGLQVSSGGLSVDVTVCRTSGNCAGIGGVGDILNNGQDGAVTVGTNDANSLVLETNNTAALTVDTSQNVSFAGNLVVAAGKYVTLSGGNTSSRPGSPSEGMMYYDTETDRLLIYSNGKWQADRSEATKIIAASNSTQTLKDAADYVADGTADESEINAALTAGAGGKVYLAEGTYVISETILVPNNTSLIGSGKSTIIELADIDASENMIENTDTSTGTGVTIRDLVLDGRSDLNTAGTQNGIVLSNVGDLFANTIGATLQNIVIQNMRSAGMSLSGADNSIIRDNTMRSNGGHGLTFVGAARSKIENNRLRSNGQYGVYAGWLENSIFAGNIADNNTLSGIGIHGSDYNTITNNEAIGNSQHGFWFNDLDNSTLSGNVAQSNTQSGFYFDFAYNNTFTANTAFMNSQHGVYVSASQNNTVSSNRMINNGGSSAYDGIGVNNSTAIQVIGNQITDNGGTGYAININSGSSTTYLANNIYSGTGAATINNASTSTVFAGQASAASGQSPVFRHANSATAFQVQNASGAGILTVDTSAGELEVGSASVAGKIVLSDGSSNTATIQVSALAGNYTVSIPIITANDAFCLVLLGNCGGGTGSELLQDGNSFGATLTVGTNDENNIFFETDGVTRFTMDTAGDFNILYGSLQTGGSSRISNIGGLQNITGYDQISGDFTIVGSGTFSTGSGAINLNGNITLGDASSDTITFTGRVNSDLLPSANDSYDLGSDTNRWRDVYIGGQTIHIGTSTSNEATIGYDPVASSLIFKNATDSTTALQIQGSSGSALLVADTTNMQVSIGVGAGTNGRLNIIGEAITDLSNWTPRAAGNPLAQWSSVAYGNGTFVAVAAGGTGNRVMTSPDGITWTARAAAEDNSWMSVAFGNGTFVAISYDGTHRVMTSPDGITWTPQTAEDGLWYAVTYGGGQFVAVAANGPDRVMTSPDGITWTARAAAEDNSWTSVVYGDGLYVAVSVDGAHRVMTSPDGVTWTPQTAAADNFWYGVTYGNGLFVAVSHDGNNNRVMTSPDGVTWSSRAVGGNTPGVNSITEVDFGGGQFVALSDRILISSDGVIWDEHTAPSAAGWQDLVYGNGTFVAVGIIGPNSVMTAGGYETAIAAQGNVEVSGSFSVTNGASIGGLLTATGDLEVQGASYFTGIVNLSQHLMVEGAGIFRGGIAIGASDTLGTLLVLDTKTDAGDPVGGDGAMYYNGSSRSFRCYQSGAWRSCIGGLVAANTTVPAGNTVANTTTETNFASNYSILGNDCQPGRVYRITAQGVYSDAATAPNLTIRLKMGTTVLAATPTSQVAGGQGSLTNKGWRVEAQVTCITTGVTGSVEAQGIFEHARIAAGDFYSTWQMANTSTVTVNTTTSQTLQLSAQWGTANASNTITLRQLIIESLGP